MSQNKTIVLGFSGASGAIYGRRLLDILSTLGCDVHVIATDMAKQVFEDELGVKEFSEMGLLGRPCDNISFHENDSLLSQLASGSFQADAMVICPCSSHSIASIASGLADTLLLRSAYVTLKQRRKLILVHREVPLTAIDLANMLTITNAGGIICPASPGFYTNPEDISDLVDSIVGRILDLLDVHHNLPIRWIP